MDPEFSRESQRDELIAVRCQLGERAAFDELIARWHEPLWHYLRRLTDAESARDLAQDAWLRIFRGIAKLREPAKIRSWLFGIAHRVAMDRLRSKYTASAHSHVDSTSLENIAADEVDDVNLEADLATLTTELASLPLIEREVLTLFYLRELSLEEIAEIAEAPVGTIKSRLFRARNLLRREMQARGVTR